MIYKPARSVTRRRGSVSCSALAGLERSFPGFFMSTNNSKKEVISNAIVADWVGLTDHRHSLRRIGYRTNNSLHSFGCRSNTADRRTRAVARCQKQSVVMATKEEVNPSAKARMLFGRMVVFSDDDLHLSLNQTLRLGIERIRRGDDPHCAQEIAELTAAEWIDAAPDGGWLLH